jgi:hypothetical protein
MNNKQLSTVAITSDANDMLDMLCKYHHLTKVELLSCLVFGLMVIKPDDVERIISSGLILRTFTTIGTKIEYPGKLIFRNSEESLPILALLQSKAHENEGKDTNNVKE